MTQNDDDNNDEDVDDDDNDIVIDLGTQHDTVRTHDDDTR